MVEKKNKTKPCIQKVREQEIWRVTESSVEMADHRVRSGWTKTSGEGSRSRLMGQEKRGDSLGTEKEEFSRGDQNT